jgi:hypothetical protein
MLCTYFNIPHSETTNESLDSAPRSTRVSRVKIKAETTKTTEKKTSGEKKTSAEKKTSGEKKTTTTGKNKRCKTVKPMQGISTSTMTLASFKPLPDEIDIPVPMDDECTKMCEEFEESIDGNNDEDAYGENEWDDDCEPWVDGGDDTSDGEYGDDDTDIDVVSNCSVPSSGGKLFARPSNRSPTATRYSGEQLAFEEEPQEY